MADCTPKKVEFPPCKNRRVEAEFSGGNVTSDGGALLLREADRITGLTEHIAGEIEDTRRKGSCDHSVLDMIRQRVYGIALGYDDLNDHSTIRKDIAIQTAVGRDVDLASAPTLCRLENRADREVALTINRTLVETFIKSRKDVPEELILDFDATDDTVHGEQERRFFHGYYGNYCFLPLYVFCGDQLLVAYLRPSNIDASKHAWAIFSLLVKRFRQEWPDVKIIFRGDSGFCRDKMLSWCERQRNVNYIVGMAKNSRLITLGEASLGRFPQGSRHLEKSSACSANFNTRPGHGRESVR